MRILRSAVSQGMGLRLYSVLMFILMLGLAGCSGDDEIIGTGGKPEQKIHGVAQKGPFIIGANVTVNLLTNTGQATTDTIITSTSDDLGNFSFQLKEPSLVQLKVDGYHFNEISGAISNGPITLNAIYDTNDGNFVVVNLLTHLITNRVRYLIEHASAPADAIVQAQTELISELNSVLLADTLPDFAQLSVYNVDGTDPRGNAYLLALSATLYNYANIEVGGDSGLLSGKLAETVNTLSADLEQDGVLDNVAIVTGLKNATTSLDPDTIVTHLTNRSIDVLGTALPIPDINLFIDTDQDGTVNSEDDDDDGDGIPDVSDDEPYTFNNIPAQETFSITIDSNPATEYTEVEDNSYVSGYQTWMGAYLDRTAVVSNALSSKPTINFLHHQDNGRKLRLSIVFPVEAAGTYPIGAGTRVYFADTGKQHNNYVYQDYNFIYKAESGEIVITEYGGVGNAVIGNFNVTIVCTSDFPQCQAGESHQLTGEFTLIRDPEQGFQSVGSIDNPWDFGPFPEAMLSPYTTIQPYFYDAENFNMVSPQSPSYYQITVNPLNQYTIEIPDSVGNVRLAVYGTASFDNPLCESSLRPATCTVTPSSETLYISVALVTPTAPGAWFRLTVDQASYIDEGTMENPVDITGVSSYFGQVGTVGSYYTFSVTPGTTHHVSENGGSMQVATDSAFTNIVCRYPYTVKTNSCNIPIDNNTTQLYVLVEPFSLPGSTYFINNWEITLPIYQLQLLQTPSVDNSGPCASVDIYEADRVSIVPALHQVYNDCYIDGFTGNVPLQPGKTYYLRLSDSLGHYLHPVDYYAIWIGSQAFAGSITAVTPDELLREPDDNSSYGATPIEFETLHYDSFKSTDDDTDWFVFTIPDTTAVSALDGDWVGACTEFLAGNFIGSSLWAEHYNGNTYQGIFTVFSTSDCSGTSVAEKQMNATISIGTTVTTGNGLAATAIDLEFTLVTVSSQTTEFDISQYGFADGQLVYDIFHIDGNNLYYGDSFTTAGIDGSSPEARPVEIYFDLVYSRQ